MPTIIEYKDPAMRLTVPDDFDPGQIPSVAAIGTFDGLHLGHMLVLATLKNVSRRQRLRPLVFSFSAHPLSLIRPEATPPTLLSPSRRDRRLLESGIEPVCIDFTEDIRRLTCAEWLRILRDRFGVTYLVLGYDNCFGSDGRHMSHGQLAEICRHLGIGVTEAPRFPGASSTEVRRLLTEGDIGGATRILGYPYTLYGKVTEGNHIGRTIGFPTANLIPEPGALIPARGVYACQVILSDSEEYPAMVNIGIRPTIGADLAPTIEAHLIDYNGNLYDKNIGIRFMKRLRDEKRFSSLETLKKELQKDRAEVITLFGI